MAVAAPRARAASTAPPRSELSARRKALVLGAMTFALFMVMLDNTVVNVALPRMQSGLAASVSELQWVVDAYVLVFASLMLTGGTLGDLYGRKRAFVAGLLVFCAGSAICAVAPTAGVLIGGRALQGLGAALLMPVTLSIIANAFTNEAERARAIGLWAGISGLALAGGPIVGGLLVDSFGWQSVFVINLPIGAVALTVALRVVPESCDPDGRRLDLPGQLLAILGVGSLTFGLIEGNGRGWTSPLIVALLAGSVVILAAFVAVEARTRTPMLQLAPFRNATFAAANVVAWLISFGMFGMFFFLSLILQEVQGATPIEAGLMSLPATLTIAMTAPIAGRIAARWGPRVPMTVGMALVGTGLLLLLRIQPESTYGDFWWALPPIGLGMGLVMAPMTIAVMAAVRKERAGMASATLATSRELGGVFGIALLGAVVTHRYIAELTDRIAGLHLPPSVQASLLDATQHGPAAGGTTPPGVDATAIRHLAGHAFVDGSHLALAIAGAALLVGAVIAATLVRAKPTRPRA